MEKIIKDLLSLGDSEYREFHSRLMPNIDKERIIGVRTPKLRAYAKKIKAAPKAKAFLDELPHRYYEENNLHGLIIDSISDPEEQLKELQRFLPYVDNWATCDLMRPKALFKAPDMLLCAIKEWIKSEHTYTIRFAMGMLHWRFLDDDFKEEYLRMVSEVSSQEYYVQMMQAWLFATALAKKPQQTLPYITERRLSPWVHNKTIQKAVESYRISEELKSYLKTLRVKAVK